VRDIFNTPSITNVQVPYIFQVSAKPLLQAVMTSSDSYFPENIGVILAQFDNFDFNNSIFHTLSAFIIQYESLKMAEKEIF
jgi:hypothetical protein